MIEKIHDSQWPSFRPRGENSEGSIKEQLAKQAESFYGWYLSVRKSSYPPEGYQGLQYLMQMGKHNTPSETEALEALHGLTSLLEDLEGGMKTIDQIPPEIVHIVDKLIEKNPKSRLVKQVTQIEIAVNLGQSEALEDLQELMDKLIKKITPEMPNIKAEALSRTLDEMLKTPSPNLKNLKNRIIQLID